MNYSSAVRRPSARGQALRAARGGVFRIPIARLGWDELVDFTDARGLTRYCADATAANAGDAKEESEDGRGVCLVRGAEGRGLSAEALGGCQPVKVPMPGEMESLNVGIAGGILMYVMRK